MLNKKIKLILCLFLSAMLICAACVPAFASEPVFGEDDTPDVPDGPDVPEGHVHSFTVWMPIPGGSVGKHVRHCECGTIEHGDCSFDDGRVTKIPSYEADGEMTYTCRICNGTKTEKINKIAPGEPNPYAEDESKDWILPIVIATVAALGTVACGVLIIVNKKKSDGKQTDKPASADAKKAKSNEGEENKE